METIGIPQWLTWIGSGLGLILSFVFTSKLILKAYVRRTDRKDARLALHATNEGKFLDADQEALKIIVARLEAVENELKEIRAAHNVIMVQNEGLKKDAEHAEKERDQQAVEIKSLRERNHTLSNELQSKDAELLKLHIEINTLRTELDLLKREVHRGDQTL